MIVSFDAFNLLLKDFNFINFLLAFLFILNDLCIFNANQLIQPALIFSKTLDLFLKFDFFEFGLFLWTFKLVL